MVTVQHCYIVFGITLQTATTGCTAKSYRYYLLQEARGTNAHTHATHNKVNSVLPSIIYATLPLYYIQYFARLQIAIIISESNWRLEKLSLCSQIPGKFNYSGVRMRLYTRSVRRSSHVQGYVASGRELCKVIDTYDTSWLVVIRLSSWQLRWGNVVKPQQACIHHRHGLQTQHTEDPKEKTCTCRKTQNFG